MNLVNNNEEKYNMYIMQEIGLDVGPEGNVYDQDTGDIVVIGGLELVGPTCSNRSKLRCHPWDSRKIMNDLFSYFLLKIHDENGFTCNVFYDVFSQNKKLSGLVLEGFNIYTNEKIIYKSQFMYKKDCLKYLDVIMQLNGAEADWIKEEMIKQFGEFTGWE